MKREPRSLRAPRSGQKPNPRITVIVADERWREDAAALRLVRRAARLGMASPLYSDRLPQRGTAKRGTKPQSGGGAAVTILLADDKRLKALNRDYRGANRPTNVLSFPAAQPEYLGDIAIAYPVVAREARAQGKSFANHAAHLALHGVLHLLGYDHIKKSEASAMESLEIKLLATLGIASPYVPCPLTRAKKAA
jgi:probable rRNA maturation factor